MTAPDANTTGRDGRPLSPHPRDAHGYRRACSLLLLATLAASITEGCAARATMAHTSASSRSELRATRILDRHRARRRVPGRGAGAARSLRRVVHGHGGRRRPDHGRRPIDPNTPWIIGSTTKTFVAVVVLQLAQEGKLDLDATIESFLPDLPAASRITTRQLLQHTSGVNEYLHTEAVVRDARREWSARELIAVAVARGPVAEPGAGYHYSNTNYLLLGEIIEKVTSRPWHAEVRSRILEPLGLRHTGYAGEPSAPRLGTGHVIEDGRFVEATDRWHPSIGGAAGGMYSTTADLLAFTLALFEGNLLDAKRMAEMRTFVRWRGPRLRRPCLRARAREVHGEQPDGPRSHGDRQRTQLLHRLRPGEPRGRGRADQRRQSGTGRRHRRRGRSAR